MKYLSREAVRQVDQLAMDQLGIPGLLLMENAARGVCQQIQNSGPWRRIVIACGHGNNGGDGLAIARLLAAEGQAAEVLLIRAGRKLSADAQANLDFLVRSGLPVQEAVNEVAGLIPKSLTAADLIVDCLLGTGMRGVVRAPFADLIEQINASSAQILAVDVPSGMDCDSGEPCGCCVRADRTVTFVAAKQGFAGATAAQWTGEVTVCQIGIPQSWLQARFDR